MYWMMNYRRYITALLLPKVWAFRRLDIGSCTDARTIEVALRQCFRQRDSHLEQSEDGHTFLDDLYKLFYASISEKVIRRRRTRKMVILWWKNCRSHNTELFQSKRCTFRRQRGRTCIDWPAIEVSLQYYFYRPLLCYFSMMYFTVACLYLNLSARYIRFQQASYVINNIVYDQGVWIIIFF